MVLSEQEAKNDPRVGELVDELSRAYGPGLGMVMKQVFRFERALWFSAFFYVLFSVVLIGLTRATRERQLSVALAVVLGVASNIVTSLLVFFATRLRRSRSRQEQ